MRRWAPQPWSGRRSGWRGSFRAWASGRSCTRWRPALASAGSSVTTPTASFVYTLATGLGLSGFVGNDADGVFVEVEGPADAVKKFLLVLERDAPPLARIERVAATAMVPSGSTGSESFTIAASGPAGRPGTLVSSDTATCADCLRELADPAGRRFKYPFINCTNCGPRFTIVRDVPYDRPLTTMADFT